MMVHLSIAAVALSAMYLCCRGHEFEGLSVLTKFTTLKVVVFGHVLGKFGSLFLAHALEEELHARKVRAARVLGYLTLFQAQLVAVLFMFVFSADDPALAKAVPAMEY